MSAITVVSPSSARIPQRDSLLRGFLDLIVDGVNLTARIEGEHSLSALLELCQATVDLSNGRQKRATVQLHDQATAWELGLEADGDRVLLTVFRSGRCPEVCQHERSIEMTRLRQALHEALQRAEEHESQGMVASIKKAQALLKNPWPSSIGRRVGRVHEQIRSSSRSVGLEVDLKLRSVDDEEDAERTELERADLHSLLGVGDVRIHASKRRVAIREVQVFLVVERLLALAQDVMDAWRTERPVFRRVEVGKLRLGVRKGPGDEPMALTIAGPELVKEGRALTFPEIPPKDFIGAVVDLAEGLVEAYQRNDVSQRRNLRLGAVSDIACALRASAEALVTDDTHENPDPESYRRFGLPSPSAQHTGVWGHGGKMRFLPRWVATVPSIDLSATFLCGERIIVGSQREMACLDRCTGRIEWRLGTQRSASVATPLGIVRLYDDGRIRLHDLATGDVRFGTRVSPRAGGGVAGALVNAPGLPKLLVVAEGERSVTAVDLYSGDIRWRFTGKSGQGYRLRRAGKLLLGAGDSALLAIDVSDGKVVWKLKDRLPFSGDTSIDKDSAFALSGGPIGPCKLHHIDLWSGKLLWSQMLEDRPTPFQAPLVTSSSIVVATRDRRGTGLKAYDRQTGKLCWEHAPGLTSLATAWLPIDDALIANSASGTLLCIDAATGQLRYNHVFSRHVEADQPRRLEPVLRNGALFVPQHQVHVVRPSDGELIGTVPCDLIPDLLRVDERNDIYVAEESGHVAAFGAAPRLTLVC